MGLSRTQDWARASLAAGGQGTNRSPRAFTIASRIASRDAIMAFSERTWSTWDSPVASDTGGLSSGLLDTSTVCPTGTGRMAGFARRTRSGGAASAAATVISRPRDGAAGSTMIPVPWTNRNTRAGRIKSAGVCPCAGVAAGSLESLTSARRTTMLAGAVSPRTVGAENASWAAIQAVDRGRSSGSLWRGR
jgi:hypothetical protein